MVIQNQEDFSRATITGGATAAQIIRAMQDVPGDAWINEFEIEYDYTGNEPFPVSFKAAVEWVKQ